VPVGTSGPRRNRAPPMTALAVPNMTADCCSLVNDGAVPPVVMSDAKAHKLGLTPLARQHDPAPPGLRRPEPTGAVSAQMQLAVLVCL
jgi:acetyl-CoA acetyltransferase